jgi:hypothetical protein
VGELTWRVSRHESMPNIHFFSPPDLQFSPLFSSFRHTPLFSRCTPQYFRHTPLYFRWFFTLNRHKPFCSNPDPSGKHGTSPPENIGGCGEYIGWCGENLKKVAKTVNRVAKKIEFMPSWDLDDLGALGRPAAPPGQGAIRPGLGRVSLARGPAQRAGPQDHP